MNDLITHAGGRQTRPDFEVLFPAVREPWMSGERQAALLGSWMINHDFAAVQWVNGRLLVKAIPVAQWQVEDTGGGCQWLRKGNLAITDGEAGLPRNGEPCVLYTLDANGDYDPIVDPIDFASLAAAKAYVKAAERIYR